MPTVLRIDGFRFHFFSNEGTEAPHIHIESAGNRAKFWLSPVALAWNRGYNESTLNRLYQLVSENQTILLEAWNEYF